MRLSVGSLLEQLTSEGLAPSGAEERARAALAPAAADDLPWYMRTAVAIGAWFATIFMLSALLAILRPRSEASWMIIGTLLMVTAVLVRRRPTSEFLAWTAVAAALAGHGMATFGAGAIGADSVLRGASVCLVSAALLIWLIRDATLRFLASLSAGGALIVALVALEAPHALDIGISLTVASVAYVWRGPLRTRSGRLDEILEPVGYGLAVVLFGALVVRTLASSTHGRWSMDLGQDVGAVGPIATVVCSIALVALVWRILDEHGTSLSTPVSFALLGGAAALGAVTWDSPGIIAGLGVLMLAFDRRNRVLLGMAAIFLIVFGSLYYYSLHLTLLQKSGVLAGSGLMLLSVRQRLVRP